MPPMIISIHIISLFFENFNSKFILLYFLFMVNFHTTVTPLFITILLNLSNFLFMKKNFSSKSLDNMLLLYIFLQGELICLNLV